MTPIIVDNCVPISVQADIQSALMGFEFPWHYYANTNAADSETREDDVPQFVHGFIQDGRRLSPFAHVPDKIITAMGLQEDDVLRAKANMLAREPAAIIHPRHIDEPNAHLVFIYYVNDADGDTCLYKGGEIAHRISPKRGRGVFFDGRTYHASSSPVEARFRCVVNFNLRHDVDLSRFG